MSTYEVTDILTVTGTPGKIRYTNGVFYVELQASGSLATTYTLSLPVSLGSIGQYLQLGGSNTLQWGNATSSGLPITVQTTDNSTPFTSLGVVGIAIPTFVTNFIYRGTGTDGPISRVVGIVETTAPTNTAVLEISDITNGNVIATGSFGGGSYATRNIFEITTITNLPAGEAIFELRLGVGGGVILTASIYSCTLYA